MKQISICLLFTILIYLISSIVSSSFIPFEWGEGSKMIFGIGLLVTWIAPIYLNYLNGDENFK